MPNCVVPFDVKSVNAPVLGVTLPIGVLLIAVALVSPSGVVPVAVNVV